MMVNTYVQAHSVKPGDLIDEENQVERIEPDNDNDNFITFIYADGGREFFSKSSRVCVQRELTVGMPATYCIGSDYYPCTVYSVSKSGHRVEVTMDDERRGLFVVRPKSERDVFTRRADGRYRSVGSRCGYLSFGERKSYRDPSF